MGLARLTLSLQADRAPQVYANGVQVPNVVGLTVRHVPPSMPQLVLELAGEVALEGEGIVAVETGPGDEIAYLRQFLANLDPDKVDDTAANLFGQEGHDGKVITEPGQAFIAAILAMLPKGP